MADVAEIVPECAVDMTTEEGKELKTVCETVEKKVVDEQGDAPAPSCEGTADKTEKETSNEVDASEKPAESCVQSECMTESCPAGAQTESSTTQVIADTTDETPSGGVKRKSEEDVDSSEASDNSKKVKTDDSKEVETSEPVTQSTEVPAVVNGDGVSENNGCHDAPGVTNGQTCDDIPPEIVTKTVEDVLKQSEDIAASS